MQLVAKSGVSSCGAECAQGPFTKGSRIGVRIIVNEMVALYEPCIMKRATQSRAECDSAPKGLCELLECVLPLQAQKGFFEA